MLQHGSFKVFLHYYGDNGLLQGIIVLELLWSVP